VGEREEGKSEGEKEGLLHARGTNLNGRQKLEHTRKSKKKGRGP